MMDYEAIEQAALAMSMDDRWDLGFLLLDTLDGLSEAEIDGGKAETTRPIVQAEDLKTAGKLSTQIDSNLAQAALSLPVKERDKLATMLIHSLDEGIPGEVVTVMAAKAAWRVEIERRAKDLGRGKARTIPWEEVKRKGRELLDELSNPIRYGGGMMDFYAIRETAMALHVDQREYLGFVLLRSLAGISETEIENDKRSKQIDSKLMKTVLSLPEEERHRLSIWLTMSTEEGPLDEWVVSPEEWDAAWGVEIDRRVRESDAGNVKSIPWEEVKRELQDLVGELSDAT